MTDKSTLIKKILDSKDFTEDEKLELIRALMDVKTTELKTVEYIPYYNPLYHYLTDFPPINPINPYAPMCGDTYITSSTNTKNNFKKRGRNK